MEGGGLRMSLKNKREERGREDRRPKQRKARDSEESHKLPPGPSQKGKQGSTRQTTAAASQGAASPREGQPEDQGHRAHAIPLPVSPGLTSRPDRERTSSAGTGPSRGTGAEIPCCAGTG